MKSRLSVLSLCLGLVLLGGCGKKGEKNSKARAANKADYVFDNSSNAEEFAFAAEDKENSSYVAEAELDSGFEALSKEEGFENIRFGFDTDRPMKGQEEVLHKDIALAKRSITNDSNVEVRAYCCEIGAADYNMALSQRRANSIKKEMASHGIPSERVNAVGCGQENPVAWSNSTERISRIRELAPNRRAEIVVSRNS